MYKNYQVKLEAFLEKLKGSKLTKVELGLADDVEELVKQAKDLIPDLDRDVKGLKDYEKSELKDMRLVEKKNAAYEKADEKYFKFNNKF